MYIPTPRLEVRLQMRYEKLVNEHLHTGENQAAGPRALPSINESFASTQAAWRFYKNPRVTLEELQPPLIEQAQREMPLACRQYGMAIHDWSDLRFNTHTSKKDRRKIGQDLGYRLGATLLISDQTGAPIAPI